MSNANPRSDSESSSSQANPDSGDESSATTDRAPSGAAAGSEQPAVEEQLERTIEERYEELEQRYDEIRDQLEDANRTAMEFIREHPGLSIGAALGFGFVVGRLASNRWLK